MKMTKHEFEAACGERLVDCRLAYETLADAMRAGESPDLNDSDAVLEWLDETF